MADTNKKIRLRSMSQNQNLWPETHADQVIGLEDKIKETAGKMPGYNLIRGSQDMSGDLYNYSNRPEGRGWRYIGEDYNGAQVWSRPFVWEGIYVTELVIPPHSSRTASIWYKSDGFTNNLSLCYNTDDTKDSLVYVKNFVNILANQWQRLSGTITNDTDEEMVCYRLRFEKGQPYTIVDDRYVTDPWYIAGFKVEEGDTATPWMPHVSEMFNGETTGGGLDEEWKGDINEWKGDIDEWKNSISDKSFISEVSAGLSSDNENVELTVKSRSFEDPETESSSSVVLPNVTSTTPGMMTPDMFNGLVGEINVNDIDFDADTLAAFANSAQNTVFYKVVNSYGNDGPVGTLMMFCAARYNIVTQVLFTHYNVGSSNNLAYQNIYTSAFNKDIRIYCRTYSIGYINNSGLSPSQWSNWKPYLTSDNKCQIMYHDDNKVYLSPWWEWMALESNGKTADGVCLMIDGRSPLVIAPNYSAACNWTDKMYGGCGRSEDFTSDWNAALSDMAGKQNNQTIKDNYSSYFNASYTGDEQPYVAVPYCSWYSRGSIASGHWWLPSLGELMIIYSHKHEINQCLSVISGAQKIKDDSSYGSSYLSSTQYNMTGIYAVNMANGLIENNYDKTALGITIPVTSMYS